MTDNAVALRPSGRLAIEDSQDFWTPEQVAALSVLGIKGATNGDLAVFFHYCRRTQLDPFSRQIYMIQRRERVGDQWVSKQTIQVGIDGFRIIRDRAAKRDGVTVDYEDTIWYDDDGREHAVWLDSKPPAACRVVLIKHTPTGDLRYPGVLRTASYIQADKNGNPVSQWKTQPEHMIEKCCEAFANRRGFPHDLAGVYIEEETPGRLPGHDTNGHRPVTVAEIIPGEPERPERPERPRRPRKTELAASDQLDRLLQRLPIGPGDTRGDDTAVLLSWLAGQPWTGTPEQAAAVLPLLEKHVADAGGDPEEAVTQMWILYDEAHAGEVPVDP